MKKVLGLIDKYFEEVILSCMMAYFVFATALQVIARYVLAVSVPWAEETARYVFIWMIFLGAAYAAKKGLHIKVDILENAMGKHGRIVKNVSSLLFLVFTLIMTYAGATICSGMISKPQYSSVLKVPMVYIYAALPVGMLITALRMVQRMWRDAGKGREAQ